MEKTKLKTLFKNFLARQGISIHFSIAIKTDDIKDIDDYINKYIIGGGTPVKLIEDAVQWYDSDEGYDFWRHHNELWLMYLEDFGDV